MSDIHGTMMGKENSMHNKSTKNRWNRYVIDKENSFEDVPLFLAWTTDWSYLLLDWCSQVVVETETETESESDQAEKTLIVSKHQTP